MVDAEIISTKISRARETIDAIDLNAVTDQLTRLQMECMQERCEFLISMLQSFLSGGGLA